LLWNPFSRGKVKYHHTPGVYFTSRSYHIAIRQILAYTPPFSMIFRIKTGGFEEFLGFEERRRGVLGAIGIKVFMARSSFGMS